MRVAKIYMLSSINHHASILHLRIHRRYIDCLTTGDSALSDPGTPEQPWNILKLRRTKWYDLLDNEQRLEVFHSLWRLYHYIMRWDSLRLKIDGMATALRKTTIEYRTWQVQSHVSGEECDDSIEDVIVKSYSHTISSERTWQDRTAMYITMWGHQQAGSC